MAKNLEPQAPFQDKTKLLYDAVSKDYNIGTYDDFDFEPTRYHAVVNWSSNPSTQAVIAGVPAFVGPSSLAYDVSNHDFSTIENPIMPDRTQWLNDLAYTEWTIEEISQGIPLKRLTSLV